MDLKQFVYGFLKIPGVPVTYAVRPKTFPCVSYHFFGERPALRGDGDERRVECSCQTDIFTTDGNDRDIARTVKQLMLENGFIWSRSDGDAEKDTGLYHHIMVFTIEYGKDDRYGRV